jgi:RHS repeat-associated protein
MTTTTNSLQTDSNGNGNLATSVRNEDLTRAKDGIVHLSDYFHGPNYHRTVSNSWVNDQASRFVYVYTEIWQAVGMEEIIWSVDIEVSGGGDLHPDCSSLEASEFFGPNPSNKNCVCGLPVRHSRADPVDTHSGNLHMPMPGVSVPGRGAGVGWSARYNSLASGVGVGLGSGWSHSYGMRLEDQPDGALLLHQETGATVRFWPDGSGWRAPSRATVTLVENGDGSFTVTRGHFEVFEFDSTGRLTALSDLHGNTTSLVYSGSELDYVEDSAGRRLDFSWSGGRITQVSAPGKDSVTPQSVTMSYEPDGDLASYTDTGGGVWSFSYDGSHRMLTMRKPANQGGAPGAVVENHYDAQGRVVWQDDELDNRTTFAYDTPAAGQTTVTETVDGSVSPAVTKTTIFTYEDGMATGVTVAPGTPQEATWHFEYDWASLGVVREVDPNGVVSEHEYDAAGNRVSTSVGGEVRYAAEFGALDLPVWVEDGEGSRSEYSWDTDNGNLLSVSANADAEDGDPVRTTTYSYGDPTHPEDVTSVTDPEGKVWSYTYDLDTGDRIGEEDPLGNETTFAFNDAGWLTSVVSPRGNASGATPADFTTTFDHDSAGRTIAVTDPEGGETERHYGASGLLQWEEDASDNRTDYTYDPAGRVTEVERPDTTTLGFEYYGDGSLKTRLDGAGEATGYTYDLAGRMVTATDPLGRTTAYGYDTGGRRVWVQAHGGDCAATPIERCTTFGYNAENEVTSVTHSDDDGITTPDVTGLAYDKAGRRTAMTDGTGTSSWDWNPFGELEATTSGNGDTVAYTYDRRGLQTSVTYPGNKTVTRGFDDAGRWTGLSDWLGGSGVFGYDESSNLEQITYPGSTGNVDAFSFDDADRLTGIAYTQGATTLGSIDYGARDANGRVMAADATGLPGPDETYGYNPLDQLSQVNSAVLGYDAADNLVVRSDGASQAFDEANQMCWSSPSGATGTCATAPSGATLFDFDDSGNRTGEAYDNGAVRQLSYDAANRLVGVSSSELPAGGEGQYHEIAPTRVLDTRNGTGTCNPSPCAQLASGTPLEVTVGVSPVPSSDVEAVAATVTITQPNNSGTVRVNDTGTSAAASLNFATGQSVDQFAIIPVIDGEITLSMLGSNRTAHAIVDISGYYSTADGDPGSTYTAITPARLMDTRGGGSGLCPTSTCTTLPAGTNVSVQAAGQAGLPSAGVRAAVLSISVAQPVNSGYLRVAPGTSGGAGTISYTAGTDYSDVIVVPLDANGRFTLNAQHAVDVVIDVSGYFTVPDPGDPTGTVLDTVTPTRIADTRTSTGTCIPAPCNKLAATTAKKFQVRGLAGVPDHATSVVAYIQLLNSASANRYLRVNPVGSGMGTTGTATINFGTAPAGSSVVAPIAADGTITLVANAAVDVIIDVSGYFAPPLNTWAYGYDGDGYRTTTTRPDAGVTSFTWDRSDPIPKLLTQHTGTGERTYLIYGPGGHPYAQITGTDVVYYHRDQLGSTRLLTDGYGDPVGSFTYDPYGKLTASTGTTTPLLGYAGEYTDSETDYAYLRARHYDPASGQFLARDPIVDATHDPYGYASGNPLAWIDPTGLVSEEPEMPPSSAEVLAEQNAPDWIVSGHRLPRHGKDRSYSPPKQSHGEPKKVSGEHNGWEDKRGNVWEWDPSGHGGPHWDVQHPNGKHTNVGEDGAVIGKDNFRSSKRFDATGLLIFGGVGLFCVAVVASGGTSAAAAPLLPALGAL